MHADSPAALHENASTWPSHNSAPMTQSCKYLQKCSIVNSFPIARHTNHKSDAPLTLLSKQVKEYSGISFSHRLLKVPWVHSAKPFKSFFVRGVCCVVSAEVVVNVKTFRVFFLSFFKFSIFQADDLFRQQTLGKKGHRQLCFGSYSSSLGQQLLQQYVEQPTPDHRPPPL